eukprot:GCRY01003902.1.p1 GENE.GCRY01003902.1~~GCRY01003902.1.p1  ORF type:complete len:722 (-),score=223.66 GCRY01003902.1:64-2229(-)
MMETYLDTDVRLAHPWSAPFSIDELHAFTLTFPSPHSQTKHSLHPFLPVSTPSSSSHTAPHTHTPAPPSPRKPEAESSDPQTCRHRRQLSMAPTNIQVSIRARARSKHVLLTSAPYLPAVSSSSADIVSSILSMRGLAVPHFNMYEAEAASPIDLKLHLPSVHLRMLDPSGEEVLYATMQELVLTGRQANAGYLHLTLADIQIDNMSPVGEYPVVLIPDRKVLKGVTANTLEMLLEWATHNREQFADYMGIRVLPLLVRIDQGVMDFVTMLLDTLKKAEVPTNSSLLEETHTYTYYFSAADPSTQLVATEAQNQEESAGGRGDTRKKYTHTQVDPEDKVPRLYLEHLEIFPVVLNVCFGDNTMGLPAIRDGLVLALDPYEQRNLYDTPGQLVRGVARSYAQIGWAEVTKILGSMDLFLSPVSAVSRISIGLKDLVMLPAMGLVLDDTPGAFFVGLVLGMYSLFRNTTLAVFISFFNFCCAISVLCARLSFDRPYIALKRRGPARLHPSNILTGFLFGLWEILVGLFSALTGLAIMPYRGAQEAGLQGFALGVGKGLLGLPAKTVGCGFDFFALVLDGLKNSFGARMLRLHTRESVRSLSRKHVDAIKRLLAAADERYLFHTPCHFQTLRRRVRPRVLVVTTTSVWILNTASLADPHYRPKVLPLTAVSDLLLPPSPPTQIVFVLKTILYQREKVYVLVPDRNTLAGALLELSGNHIVLRKG